MAGGYRRRDMPVDIEVQNAGHPAPQENSDGSAAMRDRDEQLKKFHRTMDMSQPATREKGYPKGNRP